MILDPLITPFAEFAFMRRALAAGAIVAIAAAPTGVMLLLRRMSLMGDALSHGMLPGIAIAFLIAGASTTALAFGALAAGLSVVAVAALSSRLTAQREDTGLAAFFTIALALGVVLLARAGPSVDLSHILFGSALGVDRPALMLIAVSAGVAIVGLAFIWPALVLDTVDPTFLRSVSAFGPFAHAAFMACVVIVLAGGFQAVGALMSVGLLVLPAAAARLFSERLMTIVLAAAAIGVASVVVGLLVSYYAAAPSGPCIVLAAGTAYLCGLVFGPAGGALARRS